MWHAHVSLMFISRNVSHNELKIDSLRFVMVRFLKIDICYFHLKKNKVKVKVLKENCIKYQTADLATYVEVIEILHLQFERVKHEQIIKQMTSSIMEPIVFK